MFAILGKFHRDQTDRDGWNFPKNVSGLGSVESSKKRQNIQVSTSYTLVVPNIAVMENGPGLSRR